jgi:hypothetical protein
MTTPKSAPPLVVGSSGVDYFVEDPTSPPAGYVLHKAFPDGTAIAPGDPRKNASSPRPADCADRDAW